MDIVLFRHGIAEVFNKLGEDERELTAEGIKQLKKAARGLQYLLHNRKRVHIYSSPLRRAHQTADILLGALKTEDVRLRDEIVEGRFEEMYREWGRLEPDCTVIVVGHEPSLSMWLGRLCGTKIAIKKASAVMVAAEDISRRAVGELRWYAAPETLMRIDKNVN